MFGLVGSFGYYIDKFTLLLISFMEYGVDGFKLDGLETHLHLVSYYFKLFFEIYSQERSVRKIDLSTPNSIDFFIMNIKKL